MKTKEVLALPDLITRDTIKLQAHVSDWKEAVQEAGQLLVDAGAVEPRYVDAMMRTVEELGPYIVIAPGVALPHARPEEGARRISMCFVTLEPPIEFGNADHDPVRLVVAFSAVDKDSHIQALAGLTRLLQDEEKVQAVFQARDKSEVLRLVRGAGESD